MIHDLNNGAVGRTDWNVLLDQTGGPNHVDNFCYAPVIGDIRTGRLHYMNSYYCIGHFSKFIRPGARCIISSSTEDDLQTTAFLNPDGRIAVVVLNTSDKEQPFRLWLAGEAAPTVSPAHSIMALVFANPASKKQCFVFRQTAKHNDDFHDKKPPPASLDVIHPDGSRRCLRRRIAAV